MKLQLCHDNLMRFLELNQGPLFWTYKIDGVRCAIEAKQDDITYRSRTGRILHLKHFDPDILTVTRFLHEKKKLPYPIQLDCEIATPSLKLADVMSHLQSKSGNLSNLRLYFFDLAIDRPYLERQKLLQEALARIRNPHIFYLYPHPVEADPAIIERVKDEAVTKGMEGIVVQQGTAYYENRRSWNCCKVKDFKTVDLRIVGVKEGPPGTRWHGKVAALLCDFGGKQISVSGRMNDQMREQLWKKPPIGQYVEVRYLEITPDGQLRHPTFVRFRPDLE